MPRKVKYLTEEERRSAKNKSISTYLKKNSRTILLRLMKDRDKEVLAKLDSVGNKTDYIRQLILNDINQ